ncbi:expressed unknown protein [Seminavis robusta]|uniref:Uncharacterized protein n=1 Tax=Seminavis robusta TaxID=568900 RepID=A0A9N8HEJ2_9STRA|nr:expressed unknown protein [Seminavis robusta]|eukprot:Sro518_g158800.1 n/a (289) ;mRNA; r:27288-28154
MMRHALLVIQVSPWLALVLLILSGLMARAESKVMDASDLAVGDWRVRIRCAKGFYDNLLFPDQVVGIGTSHEDGSLDKNKDYRKLMRIANFPSLLSPRQRKYDCQLSVFSNGTFVLRPEHTVCNRMSLRGRWQVDANPYCITDRFYDQLNLESCPRDLVAVRTKPARMTTRFSPTKRLVAWIQQHRINNKHNENNSNNNSNNNLQKFQRMSFQIKCRVAGRYANPLIRPTGKPTKVNVRLTHGTLLLTQQEHAASKTGAHTTKHAIGASFMGRRFVQRRAFRSLIQEE